ncbi:putative F-box protein At5g15660 [Brachypodium distachyon]|nr:putative F-box protein At5g15660 [Brachypodium distachyon]|eukprot:XP_024314338.1 putative F-box protein At5g15660 [Brachypodium distachyon]
MKRRRISKAAPIELPEELIHEILLRLPVKSLLRFKSVSKAWRTTISGAFFIRSHLNHSTSKREQNPSLLISPLALTTRVSQTQGDQPWPPTTFSTRIRFYQWPPEPDRALDDQASLIHSKDYSGEFSSVCHFAHCDGLVLLPTNTKVYLFNPATRDAITLPDQENPNTMPVPRRVCLPVGLGLDPGCGRYKVVRPFFRSRHPQTDIFLMGTQVYTVGGGGDTANWREVADPPYPPLKWITAKSLNGHVYWNIDTYNLSPRPRCLLRFSLQHETFGVTAFPDAMDPDLDEPFLLEAVRGELFMTTPASARPGPQPLTLLWALVRDDGMMNSRWELRYSIDVSHNCRPLALLPEGRVMLLVRGCIVYHYRPDGNELMEVCALEELRYQRRRAGSFERNAGRDAFFFIVTSYVESLVRLTA